MISTEFKSDFLGCLIGLLAKPFLRRILKRTNWEDFGLTFQEANLIMQRSLDIISAMVDEVYTLDASLTEFKKVSTLDGSSLDAYQKKLAEIGKTVARTGKPKSQARSDGMVNQH